MKVSVVQMNMRSLAGKENFDRAEALIRRAARETAPDVILLPETWNTGFMPAGDLAAAEIGEYGMTPEDLLTRIPRLLR